MTDKKRKPGDAAREIEANLGGLFGALGDAIGEMVARLEDGSSGAVNRDMTFDTEKGPVRAQAGIRLRMGGMEIGGDQAAVEPKPVNPDRTKPPPQKPAAQAVNLRPINFDLFEDGDTWLLTADLPGVSLEEVVLGGDGAVLTIETTGARQFKGEISFDGPIARDGIRTSLRNGILTAQISKEAAR